MLVEKACQVIRIVAGMDIRGDEIEPCGFKGGRLFLRLHVQGQTGDLDRALINIDAEEIPTEEWPRRFLRERWRLPSSLYMA